ncbi:MULTISPECIES: hypothetical protein [unclassified Thioalkalivibrio]|uniref:hypothetical protein n=1 Tax=unclassified Thioalkalivibrio TaxID=2621013 RepID=UPI00037C50E5|nr:MULTISPECIES: hypothetical protein [unclassified Thioalkalivibrio]
MKCENFEQLELTLEFLKKKGRPKGASAEPNHNDEVWTDDDIRLVMQGLLEETYKVSNPERSRKERETILRWVEKPIEPEGNRWPFSFQSCCEFLGLDPETMQQGILEVAAPAAGSDKNEEQASVA